MRNIQNLFTHFKIGYFRRNGMEQKDQLQRDEAIVALVLIGVERMVKKTMESGF